MKQAWIGGCSGDLAADRYTYPQGGGEYWETVTYIRKATQLVSAPGTIDRLFVELEVAPGAGDTRTFTLYLNGSPSALTVTISGSSDTTGSDVAHSVAVVAGDSITLLNEETGTPAAGRAKWSMMFDGTNSGESNMMGGVRARNTLTYYTGAMGTYAAVDTVENDVRQVCPLDGTIKNLYVELSADPGTDPDGYRFTLRVNGASSTLTCTITANDTTGNDTTHEVDVSPGDVLTLMCEPLNAPAAAVIASYGMTFLADVDGYSPVLGGSSGDLSASQTFYGRVSNTSNNSFNWTGTEAVVESLISECTLSDLYVLLSAAPSALDSYTFSLRKNQADPASGLSVAISDTDTTGNDTTNEIEYADGDDISIKVVPVSSPDVVSAYFGFAMYIDPGGAAATFVPFAIIF